MSRYARFALVPVAAAALALSACAGADERVREEVRQTIPTGSAPVVHVENIAGDVRVYGTKRASVQLDATKYGYDADELRGITVGAHVEGNEVFLVTTYAGGVEHGGVRYRVDVPAGASIHIANVAGAVSVSGVAGDVKRGHANGHH